MRMGYQITTMEARTWTCSCSQQEYWMFLKLCHTHVLPLALAWAPVCDNDSLHLLADYGDQAWLLDYSCRLQIVFLPETKQVNYITSVAYGLDFLEEGRLILYLGSFKYL